MAMSRSPGSSLVTSRQGIQVGVRPEQLFIKDVAGVYDLMLDATVLAVEDLGADCLIYIELSSDKSQLIWRAAAGTEVEIGEQLNLAAKSESLHLFDNQTGGTHRALVNLLL